MKDGDRVVIIEDVTTAGTSIRETVPILKAQADITLAGLVVSVDRCERGTGQVSALEEISAAYGMPGFSIVTMKEVVSYLSQREINGKRYIDETIKKAIDAYYEEYGVKSHE